MRRPLDLACRWVGRCLWRLLERVVGQRGIEALECAFGEAVEGILEDLWWHFGPPLAQVLRDEGYGIEEAEILAEAQIDACVKYGVERALSHFSPNEPKEEQG